MRREQRQVRRHVREPERTAADTVIFARCTANNCLVGLDVVNNHSSDGVFGSGDLVRGGALYRIGAEVGALDGPEILLVGLSAA